MSSSVAPCLRASLRETSAFPNRHTYTRGHGGSGVKYLPGGPYLEVAISSDPQSVARGTEMVAH